MRKTRLITTVMAVLIAVSIAQATPSTQIWIPSTDIQPYKKLHLGFDTYMKTEKNSGTREPAVINNGLTIGVIPGDKLQAEVGIDQRITGTEPSDSSPLYFNLKAGLPEDAFFKGSPAFAVGGYDFGTRKDVTDYNILYAIAAKTFALGRLSIGVFSGNDKLLVDGSGKKDNTGILASWDRTMTEISDKLWFAVDYQSTKSGYGALSAGASWKFADNVSVILAYDIYNNDNLKPTATIQVDIDLK